jgi:hypothetical protein
MTKRSLITAAAITASIVSAYPQPAFAVTIPSFPSCVNPQGNLKVSYDSGTHGIVAMSDTKTGSDKVFSLDGNNQLMQCFCPENGNGIQTNWLKVSNLSSQDVKDLENQGWTYIGDGSAWGLNEEPYVAKNSDYSCKTTTTTPTPTPTTGVVQAAKEVASLANTGNIAFIYAVAALGTLSLITGAALRIFKK